MLPYSWALDRTAAREFEGLESHVRRQVYEFLDSLARHPFQEGHMRYRDQAGFEFRIAFLGDLDVHFRLDHIVRESGLY